MSNLARSVIALAIYPSQNDAVIVSRTSNGLVTQVYSPNDDSDGDSVENTVDAFPLDVAASVDTDKDGFPDSWNSGFTVSDSTTGLQLDTFPLDSACWFVTHSLDGECDYSATMPDFSPDQVLTDDSGTIYLFSRTHGKIYRWFASTGRFGNPITVSEPSGLTTVSPWTVAYSSAHNRIYLGYDSGAIKYVDLTDPVEIMPYANIAQAVRGLAEVGQFMLAQDGSGAWNTHYIINQDGEIVDQEEWNYYSVTYDWNPHNSRVYFLRNSQSPSDLHYEEIDQQTGMITAEGETPYHTSSGIVPPVRVTEDGQHVFLGSGRIFESDTLSEVADLDVHATDTIERDGVLVFLESNGMSLFLTPRLQSCGDVCPDRRAHRVGATS